MSTKTLKDSVILKIIKATLRALSKVCDFYVRSMNKWAGDIGQVAGGMAYDESPQMAQHFPPAHSENEYFGELIRAASTRTASNNNNTGGSKKRRGNSAVARSRTVVIRKIDEDKESVFGDNEVNMDMILLRSRSHAVSTRFRKPLGVET